MFCRSTAIQSHYLLFNQPCIKQLSWWWTVPLRDQGKTGQTEALAIATHSSYTPIPHPAPKVWGSTPIYTGFPHEEMTLGLMQVCGLPPGKDTRDC